MKRFLEITSLVLQIGVYGVALSREWIKLKQDLGYTDATQMRGFVEGLNNIPDWVHQFSSALQEAAERAGNQ